MGMMYVCDLCKQPLIDKPNHKYRVKRLDCRWGESYWVDLDVHDECVYKVIAAVRKEKGDD